MALSRPGAVTRADSDVALGCHRALGVCWGRGVTAACDGDAVGHGVTVERQRWALMAPEWGQEGWDGP